MIDFLPYTIAEEYLILIERIYMYVTCLINLLI